MASHMRGLPYRDPAFRQRQLCLSYRCAIQNFPEGAIISLPLCAEGMSRKRAFICGMLSGIVEPIGGFITILIAGLITPILPYLLSFAAGAMIYVVIDELIPESQAGNIAILERSAQRLDLR